MQVQTPLHVAAMRYQPGVAELLVARGADINAKDKGVSQHWDLLDQLTVFNASAKPCLL